MAMAGAFRIEGLGAPFVEGIDGDPGNVMGLSLPLLRRMLSNMGVAITDLWSKAAATSQDGRAPDRDAAACPGGTDQQTCRPPEIRGAGVTSGEPAVRQIRI